MNINTSSQFASASASGKDWREVVGSVWAQLEKADVKERGYNLGFLYITDHLAKDAASILNLLKSLTGIAKWTGTVGIGIAGDGAVYVDKPAVSVMLGRFEEEDFCLFSQTDEAGNVIDPALQMWKEDQQAMLVVAHGDPQAGFDLIDAAGRLGDQTDGFVIGGISSSRKEHVQFGADTMSGGLSGVCFSSAVRVVTGLSQGVKLVGDPHVVTKGEGDTVYELDSQKALDVFEQDLRTMVIKMIDLDPNEVMVDEDNIPEEYSMLMSGEVHVGQLIPVSDRQDFIVRHIRGVDVDEGSMKITSSFQTGDKLVFVKRDKISMFEDLSARVVALCERVQREEGAFQPKGALYISCIGRAEKSGEAVLEEEMKIVADILGNVPITGFYAAGEINNARLHGYTALITLFL